MNISSIGPTLGRKILHNEQVENTISQLKTVHHTLSLSPQGCRFKSCLHGCEYPCFQVEGAQGKY